MLGLEEHIRDHDLPSTNPDSDDQTHAREACGMYKTSKSRLFSELLSKTNLKSSLLERSAQFGYCPAWVLPSLGTAQFGYYPIWVQPNLGTMRDRSRMREIIRISRLPTVSIIDLRHRAMMPTSSANPQLGCSCRRSMEVQKKWEGLEDSAMQIIQGHTTESTERE
ncbi:uncharacterized protein TRIREDRAFT_112255 [Trichoderma reesei QM6a]|uniref:Predicted protein n=1 Tax=Hypocrea jecorina (strain QM6a) TaxID=431241 RepID=G0RWL1_HYPJQ|nr:uncharacterized protein TRIREDRAFT_112255 [Trichoderma reesei QM6a]EGR44454.1 predicted protein [Trichoderma reesei QM6a]